MCDNIDARSPADRSDYIWGDGEPEGVRQRAAEEPKKTAIAAKEFGVSVVNGFHRIFYLAPSLLISTKPSRSDRCGLQGLCRPFWPDHGRVQREWYQVCSGGAPD